MKPIKLVSRAVLQGVLTVLFGLNLFALLLAAASPYINPKIFWPPALFGLFFKVFLIVHVVFLLIFALSRKRRKVMTCAGALLLCLPGFTRSFGVWRSSDTISPENRIKLMTYNVQSFGWYEDTATLHNLQENIHREQPDILCLQEYCIYPPEHKRLLRFFQLREEYPYYYQYTPTKIPKNNKVGLAIFSRFPFRNFTPIPFNNTTNGAMYTDIGVGKDTFRLFNVHFQSIGLNEREVKLPSRTNILDKEERKWIGISLNKFKLAFRKRSVQAEQVKAEIERSPFPVVVCGDFNDSPISFLYRQMTEKLVDTWLRTNLGAGSTFAGKIPFQRIDYILTDPAIKVEKTSIVREPGSDHYPLVCTFSLK